LEKIQEEIAGNGMFPVTKTNACAVRQDVQDLQSKMAQRGDAGGRPDTKRLEFKKQNLDDAYAVPANVLEIDVINPETKGIGKKRYTDYEVRMRVSYGGLKSSMQEFDKVC